MFVEFARAKESIDRISFFGLDGCFYDAYASWPVGNPWLGGRRTTDNDALDSPRITLIDRDYFAELVTNNPRGEPRFIVNEPYIPRGFAEKTFLQAPRL